MCVCRGMAVKEPSAKHGLRLTIEDYPYAVDGLDVWAAIREWVEDYVKLYYMDDEEVVKDEEVQSWWLEVRTVGHGDHGNATWWPTMTSVENHHLAGIRPSCRGELWAICIWGLHAQ